MKAFLHKNRSILLLTILYFIFRLPNLTLLPIFNDEAIYLDWGLRATQPGGDLYYSLYDNKQPLLMWIFGIFSRIFGDPLLGGRLVSVIAGLLTMIGIYKLSYMLFDKKIAAGSCLLYILVPIFLFFDRQALMESSIGAVGVWSAICLVELAKSRQTKYLYFLGIILGIGFFIKSSATVFIISAEFILILEFIRTREKLLLKHILTLPLVIIAVDFLLLINPLFWSTLSKNHYILPLGDIVRFVWIKNIPANIEILMIYLTPIIFLTAALGAIFALKKTSTTRHVSLFVITCLIIQTLTLKDTSQRYLVSFLPLLTIFSSVCIFQLQKKKLVFVPILFLAIVTPLAISTLLITHPTNYFLLLSNVTRYAGAEYIQGYTAGVGVKEAIRFIEDQPSNKKYIGIALNAGNPESSMMAYFNEKKDTDVGYLDSTLFGDQLQNVDCLRSSYSIYFVSRDEQQAGLNKYFRKIKSFKNPNSNNSIGIYTLDEDCEGTPLQLEPNLQ